MKSCVRSLLRWRSPDQSKGFNVSSQVGLGLVFSLLNVDCIFNKSKKSGGNLEYDIYVHSFCAFGYCPYVSLQHLIRVFFRETCQAEKGVLEQKLEDSKKEVPLQHCMSD